MARKSGNGYSNIGSGGAQRVASIAGANGERLIDVLERLFEVGDAMFLSRTRNGSAIRVQVYSGDDKPDWYVGSADDFDALMLELRTYLDKSSA